MENRGKIRKFKTDYAVTHTYSGYWISRRATGFDNLVVRRATGQKNNSQAGDVTLNVTLDMFISSCNIQPYLRMFRIYILHIIWVKFSLWICHVLTNLQRKILDGSLGFAAGVIFLFIVMASWLDAFWSKYY